MKIGQTQIQKLHETRAKCRNWITVHKEKMRQKASSWRSRHPNFQLLISDIFQSSLLTYLLLLLLEEYKKGFASIFFRINYVFYVVVISGVLAVVFGQQQKILTTQKHIRWYDFLFLMVMGCGGAVFIFFKMQQLDLRWVGNVLSVLTGLLIITISYLIYTDTSADR